MTAYSLYITRCAVQVRAQSSAFAPVLLQLSRATIFRGVPARDRAWVCRLSAGYIEKRFVRTVEPSTRPCSRCMARPARQGYRMCAVCQEKARMYRASRRGV